MVAVDPLRAGPLPPVTRGIGMVEAETRSVAGVSGEAVTSMRWVSPAVRSVCAVSAAAAPDPVPLPEPTTSVGAELASTEDAASPFAPVPPNRRSKLDAEESGTRSATCFTAWWPRSIDWAKKAVPAVAAAEPIATPMIVPLTPNAEAISAAITAPAAEARIWRTENFTPGLSSRPPPAPRRGR